MFDLESSEHYDKEEVAQKSVYCSQRDNYFEDSPTGPMEGSEISEDFSPSRRIAEHGCDPEHQMLEMDLGPLREAVGSDINSQANSETDGLMTTSESGAAMQISNGHDTLVDETTRNKQTTEKRLPETLLPLLRYHQYESSESSTRYLTITPFDTWGVLFSWMNSWSTYLLKVCFWNVFLLHLFSAASRVHHAKKETVGVTWMKERWKRPLPLAGKILVITLTFLNGLRFETFLI